MPETSHTTTIDETISSLDEKAHQAYAASLAATKKREHNAKLRKRIYYTVGGVVLVGAVVGAAYYFIPGFRKVATTAAQSAADAAIDTVV